MLELAVKSGTITEIDDIGYAMVRPDGMQLGLDEAIIHRITESGLLVLKRKISVTTPEQVDRLYPDLHDRSYYRSMKESMVGRRIMSLVVGGHAGVSDKLLGIRGSATQTSGTMRGDYSAGHLLTGELYTNYKLGRLTDEQLKSPEWSAVMRDDRMHSDETTDAATNSIRVMFSESERQELIGRYPNVEHLVA